MSSSIYGFFLKIFLPVFIGMVNTIPLVKLQIFLIKKSPNFLRDSIDKRDIMGSSLCRCHMHRDLLYSAKDCHKESHTPYIPDYHVLLP